MTISFREPSPQDEQNKSGLFVKLKADKDFVRGVFRGQITEYYQHWFDRSSGRKPALCTDQGCVLCASGNKRSFKFRLNIIFKDKESQQWVAKIFEGPFSVYDQLRSLQKSGWNIEKNPVTITRNGTERVTYSVVPIPNAVITPEQELGISAVKLHDLSPTQGTKPQLAAVPGAQAQSQPSWDDDLPF